MKSPTTLENCRQFIQVWQHPIMVVSCLSPYPWNMKSSILPKAWLINSSTLTIRKWSKKHIWFQSLCNIKHYMKLVHITYHCFLVKSIAQSRKTASFFWLLLLCCHLLIDLLLPIQHQVILLESHCSSQLQVEAEDALEECKGKYSTSE